MEPTHESLVAHLKAQDEQMRATHFGLWSLEFCEFMLTSTPEEWREYCFPSSAKVPLWVVSDTSTPADFWTAAPISEAPRLTVNPGQFPETTSVQRE